MSFRISSLIRAISQAGVLALALAGAPRAHGQDGARALLNQTGAPAGDIAADGLTAASVSGQQALLGHSGGQFPTEASRADVWLSAPDTVALNIDGARALTGSTATLEARRRIAAKPR